MGPVQSYDYLEKAIEKVQVGDQVWSKNPDTGEVAFKKVDMLFQRPEKEIWKVYVGDEIISTSEEHPFWIKGKGWVMTKDLIIGDLFETSDGSHLSVDKIEVKQENTTVYNFRVKDFHTYYLSNLKILTHNTECPNYSGVVTGKTEPTISSGSPSFRLRDALTKAGIPVPETTGNIKNWEAHHIVPEGSTHWSAEAARDILVEYGIGVNSATNGVWLPKVPTVTKYTELDWTGKISTHNGRHVNNYFDYVYFELIYKIIDMRRYLVMTQGEMPSDVSRYFQNIERQINPWGINRNDRIKWWEGLEDIVKTVQETEEFDVLFWVGSMGSFDIRSQNIARSFARLMNKAGVKFAVLGNEEKNSGDTARRMGNEYLIQDLCNQNMEAEPG